MEIYNYHLCFLWKEDERKKKYLWKVNMYLDEGRNTIRKLNKAKYDSFQNFCEFELESYYIYVFINSIRMSLLLLLLVFSIHAFSIPLTGVFIIGPVNWNQKSSNLHTMWTYNLLVFWYYSSHHTYILTNIW